MTATANVILVVEDNPGDARLLREMINEQDVHKTRLKHCESMSEAEAYLAVNAVDIILLDLGLGDAHGLDAVHRAHAAAPAVPLVVLTGTDDEVLAASALNEGAQDYLIKGQIDARGLLRALRYAIERKRMDVALFAEREQALVTLNCIADAVVCTDSHGRISFLNRVAETMTGWSVAEAMGRPISEILSICDSTTRELLPDLMTRAWETDPACEPSSNSVLIRRDGLETAIEDSVAPIHDSDGLASGAVIVFRDVGASRAMARQLSHSANHDFLTGLPNRMLLNDRVSQAIALAPRHSKRVGILFLDLDGFKHINDSLGHPAGDKLLQSISTRLVGCVRGADTVSRQGGDEFVVLLSEMERYEDAAISAIRMLESVAQPHLVDGQDLHVTTSIGVSVYPDDGLDAETLIKHADMAMYQAKENGRQGYRFFKPEMNVQAVERHAIETSLRRALERRELVLHYQPKVDLNTGAIAGAEALIRWMHPTRGLLSPAEFIPVAEASGLIKQISHWVLDEACRQTRAWLDEGLVLPHMAVNISAIEFRDENFFADILAVIESADGIDPPMLELELTESALMRQVESTGPLLQALRGRGVKLAIDDFGTGYSSLSYLSKFPLDTLKIDRSFVRGVGTAGVDTSILTAIINMGRGLGLQVVAEGVETSGELAFLQANHCEVAQGFYFSRPLPAPQFARLLQTGILSTMAQRRLEAQSSNAANERSAPRLLTAGAVG